MNIPKQRLYRALVKSEICTPEQFKEVEYKLTHDDQVKREFLWLWRSKKGRLFVGLRSLIKWVYMYREEIIRILGITAPLLLDEEENKNGEVRREEKREETPKRKVTIPPRPSPEQRLRDLKKSLEPSVVGNEVVEDKEEEKEEEEIEIEQSEEDDE